MNIDTGLAVSVKGLFNYSLSSCSCDPLHFCPQYLLQSSLILDGFSPCPYLSSVSHSLLRLALSFLSIYLYTHHPIPYSLFYLLDLLAIFLFPLCLFPPVSIF